MKLLVQKFLETKSFGDLIKEHGVYASVSKNRRKISMNYDMLETKENDELSYDCRGLILSRENFEEFSFVDGKLNLDCIVGNTQIIAFPMRRFFNHGQGAAFINWDDPKLYIFEKLDGSLIINYFDPFISKWCVATRGIPDADLLMDNGLFTFRTLFEKAVQDTLNISFDTFTKSLVKEMTYCFELTTPLNRIVVNYPTYGITLLSARYLPTLKELNPSELAIVQMGQVPYVKAHTYTSIDEIVSWVSTLNPLESEGVVVRDSNFNRIKVKNANYVAYNKLNDRLGASERNCLELILAEKDDDVVSFLPEEIAKNLQKIKIGVNKFIKEYDSLYQELYLKANAESPGNKKTFALLINENKDLWTAPLFTIFAGKALNIRDFIAKNRKDGTWSNSFLDKILNFAKIL